MPMKLNKNYTWNICPSCNGKKIFYKFTFGENRVQFCSDCDLMGISPQPNDEELSLIYSDNYFPLSSSNKEIKHVRLLKTLTAELYLKKLFKYLNISYSRKITGNCKLLEIGTGMGDFLEAARKKGFDVTGLEFSESSVKQAMDYPKLQGKVICGTINNLKHKDHFDVIVINDVLEHIRNPNDFLHKIYSLLKKGGVLFCTVPSLDSFSAKLQGFNWVEFKTEHLFYYNDRSLKTILASNGFVDIQKSGAKKVLSLNYILSHFDLHKSAPPLFGYAKFFPNFIKSKPFQIIASGSTFISKKRALPSDILKLDIVLPVFNEFATIEVVINKILNKKIDRCSINLIVIESKSSDGTRDLLRKFLGHPRIKIIFQDTPKGKGFAVREGLKHCKGEVVLIQDGDLEYDFNDYDALIQTIRNEPYSFVLGSRHGGGKWKVRHFEDQPLLAFLANVAHWGLTFLINLLFNVRLTDPFTMFKVFNKSSIDGLNFTSNRFDFDYELLLKLIRRGYKPIEIPVNYNARSFKEGKKVNIFRDPITWVWAIFKFRFCKILNEK